MNRSNHLRPSVTDSSEASSTTQADRALRSAASRVVLIIDGSLSGENLEDILRAATCLGELATLGDDLLTHITTEISGRAAGVDKSDSGHAIHRRLAELI